MIKNEVIKREKKRCRKGVQAAAAFIALPAVTVLFAAEYLFHYIVCRKRWELPEFLMRRIAGNDPGGRTDPYEEEVMRRTKELEKEPMEDLKLTSADGLTLRAKLWRAEQPSDRLIVCVHGCRSSGLKEFCFAGPDYHRMGCHVLFVDQRACGASEGDYMSYGYFEAGDIARWVRGIDEYFNGTIQIWLHGISMGGATVLMLSGMRRIRGIIADCSYTDAWEEFAGQLTGSFHLPEWPLLSLTDAVCRRTAGFSFRDASPLQAVKRAEVPVLFVHGGKDDYVPTRMGKQLYDACASEKDLLIVEDAVHARSYYTDTARYLTRVSAWMEKTKEEMPE